jgi:PAS domain S-box-containing protein/diguanylate cyclase (GGDEF)-like protein
MKRDDMNNSLNAEPVQEQSAPGHTQDALRESETHYRTIFENSDSATLIIEDDMTICLANARFEELSGYSKAEVEGKLPWTIAIHPDDIERLTTYHVVRRERPEAVPRRYDFRIKDKQGKSKDIYASVAMIPGTRKSVASLTDITDLKKTERELRKLSLAVEASSDWVLMTDGNGSIEYVNNAVLDLSGYSREELIGQNPRIFSSGKTDPAVYRNMWNTLRAGWPFQAILTNRRKNGELYEIFHSITPLMDEEGAITHFISSSRDLTQMKLLEDRLNYLANYDSLTGLPNQTLLLDRIKLEIPRGEFRKRLVAVLCVDIDRLSFISKTLGTEYADAVLREVGQRLTSVVRKGDTVARLGRDKFSILLVDMAHSEDILLVVGEIFNVLKPALSINDTTLVIAVHMGISLAPQDTDDAADLVKNAETALSKSREQGLNTYQFFTADMNHRASALAQFQRSLFHAVKNNEFELYYQPYFDVHSRKIAGMEALIRWNSPEHGFVTPAHFIPVLEETRMIADVGRWVVREACRQIKAWQDKGYAMVPVTTNLSAVQFRETDLGDVLERVIKASGIDTKFLAFELTESTLVQKPGEIRAFMSRLKNLGCTISIDDFGTGYSSLSYLKNLPADNLKIDISFIRDIAGNADDAAIVSSVVSLAHNLRLKTIAEGVETEEQLKVLHMLRCDMVQGYYFSKPVPAGIVEAMLAGK